MNAKSIGLLILGSAILLSLPLRAQQEQYIVNGCVVTVQPLDPPAAAPAPTTLDRLEAAFYGGTISLRVAVQMVNQISYAGGNDFIEQHGYDPTTMPAGSMRDAHTQIISAIEYDRRLDALINAINAAIEESNEAKQAANAQAEEQARRAAIKESKRRARQLYPDIADPNSALCKKWYEIYNEMSAAGTLPDSPDRVLIITVRAANLLHIMPRSE